jgi:hypothetical protein
MSCSRLDGWRSEQRVSRHGDVESTQRVLAGSLVVPGTTAGAARLGDLYWAEVVRFTRGLVRVRAAGASIELRVLGRGPALLRFGPPVIEVSDALTRCAYPIRGGGLARRAGGEIAFAQAAGVEVELSSVIRGFFPTLAARPGGPRWAGLLYSHGQRRIHLAISRRYFRRLIAEAPA